jgi:adenylate cyclase
MNSKKERKIEEENELAGYEQLLETEINLTLKNGGLLAGVLGVAGGFVLWLLGLSEILPHYEIPAIWGTSCGLYGFFVSLMARSRLIKGSTKYWVFFPLISLPTIAYTISYFFLPSGTATYITGVPSYLYLFVIIMTGFLFDKKISILSGIIVGIEYFAMYIVGREHLLQIVLKDDILFQDLTGYPMYFIKSSIMVFTGFMMGILSENVKKLMITILKEEKEKHQIDKLFGQFVSNEIKDKIIAEKKDIIAENKTVAVLFSDIREFTNYSENNPPEVVVSQLNQYFDKMVYCITQNGGTIDKFIGDAIMAVFGGLIELENPCESAVKAGLMMKVELNNLNQEWEKIGFQTFKNGIGLSYGAVTQGTLGSKDRKEFTVIGDTVNSASRLEGITKDFPEKRIILSSPVYENLPEYLKIQSEYLATVHVKGKQKPITIYGLK